jgi:tetratricopeptide (TPR) repeat protein
MTQTSVQSLYEKVQQDSEAGRFEAALDSLNTLQALFEKESLNTPVLLLNKGVLLTSLEKFSEAEKNFKTAAELFEQSRNHEGMATAIGNIGSIHRDTGEFEKAIFYYERALTIFQDHENFPGMATQHTNIGYAGSQLGLANAAIKHFEKAAELYDRLGAVEQLEMTRKNIELLKETGEEE